VNLVRCQIAKETKDMQVSQMRQEKLAKQLKECRARNKQLTAEEALVKKIQACSLTGPRVVLGGADRQAKEVEEMSYKTRINNLKMQVAKLEQSEKKLKNMLVERENQFEQEYIELKRLLNAERRRVKEVI
jgi:hypothetical protein